MTVEFNHEAVMKMYEAKRKKFLTMTGHQGANLAAINSRVDTGTSQSAKSFSFTEPGSKATFKDRVYIIAPLEYDIYLERRYGIMVKTEDELIPHMEEYERVCFGE